MRGRPCLCLLLFLSWLVGLTATAQSAGDEDAYLDAVRQAVGAFDAGEWSEARGHFERAHAIQPSARTLRGLGMCAFEMGEMAVALDFLGRSLEDERRPLTDAQRDDVAELIERAHGSVGRFALSVDPPEAELLVDGHPPSMDGGGEMVLELGEHIVQARLDGYATETRELEVRGGEQLEVSLLLEPQASSSDWEPPLETIILGGAAAGTLVVDLIMIGWAVDRQGEWDRCAAGGALCRNAASLAEQRDASAGLAVFFGLTTIGLATAGAVLWVLSRESSSGEQSGSVRCAPGIASLACAASF